MDIRWDSEATAVTVSASFGGVAEDWAWCPDCQVWSNYSDDPYGTCQC
jgi:hypothetical protein